MKKNISVLTLCAILFALFSPAEAQQGAKVPRVGYVAQRNKPTPTTPDPAADAFRHGLQELGYIEGKNIMVEYHYAEGNVERLRELMAELTRLKLDVLVTPTTPGIQAAKQATKTIPIVMVTTVDPVATGLVASLARPGGNITGVTRLTQELSGKRLELLKEVLPGLSRVGVLWDRDGGDFKMYETPARALKIQLQSLEIQSPSPDFAGAFQAAANASVTALITVTRALILSHPNTIAELAIKNRLPSMHERNELVAAGGLISYSSRDADSFRRAAVYVDKILKGAKPADLPIEQPTKFELVINLKTAKRIGLTIPQSVLYRADKVTR